MKAQLVHPIVPLEQDNKIILFSLKTTHRKKIRSAIDVIQRGGKGTKMKGIVSAEMFSFILQDVFYFQIMT